MRNRLMFQDFINLNFAKTTWTVSKRCFKIFTCDASWLFCAQTQNNDQVLEKNKILIKETFTKFRILDNMTKIRNVEESHC